MENIHLDESVKQSLKQNIRSLIAFGTDPRENNTWSNASSAIGEFGNISVKYLAGKDVEDIAFSSSMTRLYEAAEDLHRSPRDANAKQNFDIALGDIQYRIKRLFGVILD
jgi:hypothetical protein